MTVDREQIRRDAEGYVRHDLIYGHAISDFAKDVLALLTELEEAEDAIKRYEDAAYEECKSYEARLANVPPLVEALRETGKWISNSVGNTITEADYATITPVIERALAAWDAE